MLRSAVYYWDNLRRLSIGQTAWRIRNRLLMAKLVDPVLRRREIRQAPRELVPGPAGSSTEFLAKARAQASQNAFLAFDPADAAARVRRHAQPEVDQWIELADATLCGEYRLIADQRYALGFPPADWQHNPSFEKEWLHALHRTRLFAAALAKARLYDGARRYADGFQRVVDDWIARNPCGAPVAWLPMETSVRLHGWLWAYKLLLAADALEAEFHQRFVSSLALQAEHLSGRLEKDLLENHLVYNYFALFLAGLALPLGPAAQRWLELGHAGLLTELRRQFHPDGLHTEQSSHYHVAMAVLYVEWHWYARRAGLDVPAWAAERVAQAVEACLLFWRGGEPCWLLSDAFYSFMSWDTAADVRTTLLCGAVLFDRPELATPLDRPSEWGLLLLGAAADPYLTQIARPERETLLQRAGGYCAVRSGPPERRAHLLFDGGPYAMSHCAGHAHSDSLSLVWSVGPQVILADPGVWTYEPSPEAHAFKRSLAHNTLLVDGQDQAFAWRFHRWCFLPRVETRVAERRGAGFYFEGEHDGYQRLPAPVRHRRCIWYVPGAALLVEDSLIGHGQHALQLVWRFGAGLEVRPAGALLRFGASGVDGALEVRHGAAALTAQVEDSAVCPDYGRRLAAPRAVYSVAWTPSAPPLETTIVLADARQRSAAEIRAAVSP